MSQLFPVPQSSPARDVFPTAAYAAYFNVARHNFLLVLNSISQRSGLGSVENDDQIGNHPLLQKLGEWQQAEEAGERVSDRDIRLVKSVLQSIQKALPILHDEFMQAITGQKMSLELEQLRKDGKLPKFNRSDRKKEGGSSTQKSLRTMRIADFYWVLWRLANALKELRNFYTHAHQNPANFTEPFAHLLNTWFDAGRREAKNRFGFLERDVNHLLRFDKDTKKEILDAPHLLSQPEGNLRSLTPRGAAFFCCLFLDKQQGNEFLKQLSGFKQDHHPAHQATLRTYTHWSITLPFVRIETDSTAQSLALDIFNELTRCPSEIYEHLSPEQQKEFEIAPEQDSDFSPEGEMSTRMIRHSDRFALLALQYFDQLCAPKNKKQSKNDPGIRFQLDLGDFYFAVYPKDMPDGGKDTRRLKQKILRFGLPSEAFAQNENKPDAWKALERVNTERDYDKPYIVETRPHFHLPELGSIPIKLNENCAKELYSAPVLDTDPKYTDGRYEQIQPERPDFWLSPHELASLAFYHQLLLEHDLNMSSVSKLLKDYQASLMRLFEEMRDSSNQWLSSDAAQLNDKLHEWSAAQSKHYHFRSDDLPQDLQKLLLQKPRDIPAELKAQAINSLDLLIEDGTQRLRSIARAKQSANERIKPGKKAHRTLRSGEMASFLAQDMLRLQPEQNTASKHKGKPTSIMADLLQARLAYFGRDKTSLPALLTSLGLTGHDNPQKNHPFLSRIQVLEKGMNGIAQYYEAYLNLRQKHLQKLRDELANSTKNLQSPEFAWLKLAKAPARMKGKDDLAALLDTYLNRLNAKHESYEPLNLPRGLFRLPCLSLMKSLDHSSLNLELDELHQAEIQRNRPTSMSQLIDVYMRHQARDCAQDFYFYDRSKLEERIDEIENNWQQSQWAKGTRERLQAENRRLFGAALDAALLEERNKKRKTLRNFKYDADRILNQRAAQDQILFLAARYLLRLGGTAENSLFAKLKLQTLKRDDLDKIQVSHEQPMHGKTIYIEKIKAKNIGDFKRLARDRRLPGLLHYYDAKRISLANIAHELQAYPRAQNQAFKEVLQFEAANNPRKIKASDIEAGSSLHKTLMEQALKKSKLKPDEQTSLQAELLTLRNAFCHNQIPEPKSSAQYPEAQPMLESAKQSLAPNRQSASGIEQIKGSNEVAAHFSQATQERYARVSSSMKAKQ